MASTGLMNQKGGTGKTTTVINLAAQAALKDPTLMIDCDPQSNLTEQFSDILALEGNQKGTTRDLFFGKDVIPIEVRKNLFLIPSGDLEAIDLDIQHKLGREYFLKKRIDKLKTKFKHIFLDCPPARNIVTINVLCACDYVIIPVKAAYFSMQGVEGMVEYVTMVIEQGANPDLVLLGILVTHYDDRLNIGKWILEEFKKREWDSALFKTMIHDNTDIEAAQFMKQTIFEYNRKSKGAQDYASLGQEVLKKIKNIEKQTV